MSQHHYMEFKPKHLRKQHGSQCWHTNTLSTELQVRICIMTLTSVILLISSPLMFIQRKYSMLMVSSVCLITRTSVSQLIVTHLRYSKLMVSSVLSQGLRSVHSLSLSWDIPSWWYHLSYHKDCFQSTHCHSSEIFQDDGIICLITGTASSPCIVTHLIYS